MLADLYVADILTNSTTSVYKQQNLWTTNSSILREAGTDHHSNQTRAWPPYPTVHQQYFKGQAKEFMQTLIDTISFNTQPDEWQKSALLKTNGDKTRLTVQVLCSKLSSTMNSWSCPANPTYSPTDHPPLTIPHWPSGSNFKQRDRTIADWWDKQKGNRTTRLTSTDPRHDVCDVFERAAMDVLRSAVHLWHLVCDGHQWSQGAEQRVQ